MAEGSSDELLLPPLLWLLNDIDGSREYDLRRVDLSILPDPPRSLSRRIAFVLKSTPMDLLLVHRDADRDGLPRREREIGEAMKDAVDASGTSVPFVPVVPIRTTEAWLLIDEDAIREAAGDRGDRPLGLPRAKKLRGLLAAVLSSKIA